MNSDLVTIKDLLKLFDSYWWTLVKIITLSGLNLFLIYRQMSYNAHNRTATLLNWRLCCLNSKSYLKLVCIFPNFVR